MSGVSFALLAFGTLLFTVVLAFLLLNMTKERTELHHKIASLTDPLSGVPNRRAFIDGANSLLVQQSRDYEPLAVFLFDLDHFKSINDKLGHGTGDTVLQIFAATAARTLGGDNLFGRVGGEEFAAVIAVGDIGEARPSPTACAATSPAPPLRMGPMEFFRPSALVSRWVATRRWRSARCWRPPTRRFIAPRRTAAIGWSAPSR